MIAQRGGISGHSGNRCLDLARMPYGRVGFLQTSLPDAYIFDAPCTSLTPSGKMVSASSGCALWELDLATGALRSIRGPITQTPMGLLAVHHKFRDFPAGTLLLVHNGAVSALSAAPDGTWHAAALPDLPETRFIDFTYLSEQPDGSILLGHGKQHEVFRIDAASGLCTRFAGNASPHSNVLDPVNPLATSIHSLCGMGVLPDGTAILADAGLRRVLQIREHPASVHPAFTTGAGSPLDGFAGFLAEPDGTLLDYGCRFRINPATGILSDPLAFLPVGSRPRWIRASVALPDGSWICRAIWHEGEYETLSLISPADPLQARLESLVASGRAALEAGDPKGYDTALGRLAELQASGKPPADIHPEAFGALPKDLAGLVAEYTHFPLMVKLRARLAFEYLRALESRKAAAAPVAPAAP